MISRLLLVLLLCQVTACTSTERRSGGDVPETVSAAMVQRIAAEIGAGRLTSAERILAVASARGLEPWADSYLRARLAFARQDVAQAAYLLKDVDPPAEYTAEVALLRGRVAEAQGDWQAAYQAYSDAVSTAGAPAMLAAARSLIAAGDPLGAAQALASWSAAGGEDRQLLQATAEAWLAAERPERAVPLLREAVLRDPSDLEARILLVVALHRQQQHWAVIAEAAAFPGTPPPVVLLALGRSQLVAGLWKDAVATLEDYLEQRRDDGPAWLDLARARYMANDVDGAVAAAEESLRHSSAPPRAEELLRRFRSVAAGSGTPAMTLTSEETGHHD